MSDPSLQRDCQEPRPVKPPGFELIPEGDTPLFEGAGLLGSERGGYLPEPETCSILDTTPKAEERDYTIWIAAVAITLLLAVALRVVVYYAAGRPAMDNTPLEARAHIVPLTPLPPADPKQADNTIYYPIHLEVTNENLDQTLDGMKNEPDSYFLAEWFTEPQLDALFT